MTKQQNRRAQRSNLHEVVVTAAPDGSLLAACGCGLQIGNRRDDKRRLSLSDMLALVRQHSIDLDDPKLA